VDSGFRYLDHITDLVIEASGGTIENAFENSASGLVHTMFDISRFSPILDVLIEATGHDMESLLYNWLEKVLLLMLVEKIIVSNFKVRIIENQGKYSIVGEAMGEKIDLDKHSYKIEIKGVTYHEMEINQHPGDVTIRFMLDL
jgi:SHS2 domain-containing protein